ncbi:MAG: nucleoside triphosphate pyrophosphohydrolase [Alphaproteobacteria bacterium]|nr:nucleoside triphosphate pyrophosphohydrolase [Alphaproteobacteria bacterium]
MPPVASDSANGAIGRLLAIMARLRDPSEGCPWDREQDFGSIAPYTIEEAYEVAEAIRAGDMGQLKDELGDLLFQVVFHARMAEEAGAFGFADVVAAICDKMERRHPHVFGATTIRSAAEQTVAWEEQKAAERAAAGAREGRKASLLDGVTQGLPGLTRAVKLQNRAARVGFDWPALAPVLAKIDEEFAELRAEIAQDAPKERIEDEFGDLLFVVANLARHLDLDPEAALRRTNAKFERRFRRIEALLAERGRRPDQSDLAEMDALWDQAKAEERA